ESARRLGYHPAAVPTSVNSRPYRDRPACVDCAFCLHYGCPINAKGGGVWQLQDAMLTGRVTLRSEANVTRIETSPVPGHRGKFRATGVTWVDASGAKHTETADLVVLANSPIEATRLSFVSGIGTKNPDEAKLSSPQPAENEPSGLLGRNLMFHLQTTAIAIVNRDIHSWRGRTSTHTLDAFAGAGPDARHFDPEVPRGGIVEIGGNINPIAEGSQMASFAYGERHKALMQVGPFRKRITAFTLQGEDMPQITNYVDLDPSIVDVYGVSVPRVTYQSHPYELAASAYYTPLMLEILENLGGPGSKYPEVRTIFSAAINTTIPAVIPGPLDAGLSPLTSQLPFSEVPASAHIMGTHRMAMDPAHGPCDPFGRYWAFDNLYHAGGGLYVTAPGFNVTLTIWALAYWVGAAVVAGVGGKQSYRPSDMDDAKARLTQVIKKQDPDTMIARVV
ncbi:MAG: GMC oxidoreductase, partial [Acidimicrobiales bacterium]